MSNFLPEDNIRLISININGFPSSRNGDKYTAFHEFIQRSQPDIVALQECNQQWHHKTPEDRLPRMADEWFGKSRVVTAHFKDYPDQSVTRLFGGTSIIILPSARTRFMTSGIDPSGMGRWCWVQLRGSEGRSVVVVSLYRPVFNKHGTDSVWSQQKTYIDQHSKQHHPDPRQAVLYDVLKDMQELKQQGAQFVICMDTNETTLNQDSNVIEKTFAQLNLADTVLHRHSKQDAPGTTKGGTKPVDCIMASPGLQRGLSGYLPFEPTLTDHRPIFMEFRKIDAFGRHANQKQIPPSPRRLTPKDPRIYTRYNNYYKTYAKQHRLYERSVALENSTCQAPLSASQQHEYEVLDKLREQGKKAAEKRCRKLKMGNTPFSPVVKDAMLKHRFWFLLGKYRSGSKPNMKYKYVCRIAKQANLMHMLHTPVADIESQRAKAWTKYRLEKRNGQKHRTTWFEGLVTARVEAGLEKAADAMKVMRQREKQRHNARLIKWFMNDTIKSGLSVVEGPHVGRWDNGEWQGTWARAYDKASIEQYGLEENDRRFRQGSHTPLMQPEVTSILGTTGCTEAATRILNGELNAIEHILDKTTKAYFEELQTPWAIKRRGILHMDFSSESYMSGWKKMNESTSSSYSQLHFGHYMAPAYDYFLGTIDAALAAIPAQTGYVPTRWLKGLNVMIPKKANNIRVTKLRTILLYEADFNQNNKLMARTFMKTAERHHLLAPEQYGSRKHHNAQDQALNKCLTFDILRQMRQRACLCACDLKSCYDRLGHVPLGLSLRRMGVPATMVDVSLKTLQRMTHYLRTTYGVSSKSFQADNGSIIPVHGCGQGNGAGPGMWAIMSTPIFNAMRRKGYGIYLHNPISHERFHFVGYAFVDDTDLVFSDNPNQPVSPSIVDVLQEGMNWWEGLVTTTAGAVEPEKSHWYLIDFEWSNGAWEYTRTKASPVTVLNPYGRRQMIDQYLPNHAEKTLGILQAPNGQQHTQFKKCLQDAKDWADKIRTKRMPAALVWQSMTTGILKKLQWPLITSSFTKRQCKEIMSPLLQAGLSNYKIVRTLKRSVVHGPNEYCGLGIPNLYIEQGLLKLDRLARFGPSYNFITGYLIRDSVELFTLELGLPGNPFHTDYSIWSKCVTQSWVKSAWQFLSESNIRLLPTTPALDLLRDGDFFLMVHFHQAGYSPAQLRLLNTCRQALHAITLADITNAMGTHILDDAYFGRAPTGRRNIKWPRQPPLQSLDWRLWQHALHSTFSLDRFRRLSSTLGHWKDIRSLFGWFYSPSTNRLLLRHSLDDWTVHSASPRQRGTPSFFKESIAAGSFATTTGHGPLHIADIRPKRQHSTLVSLYQYSTFGLETFLPTIPPHPPTFNTSSLGWVAQHWFTAHEKEDIDEVATSLQEGTAEAVSDGSAFENDAGTASWTIAQHERLITVSAGFRVPGPSQAQCSYRSELAGIYAILLATKQILSAYHIQSGGIEIATDSKSVLDRLFHSTRPATLNDHSFDLLAECQSILSSLPEDFVILTRHVAGHQDDTDNELDIWAERNILMDAQASQIYTLIPPNDQPTFTPTNIWQVRVGDQSVVHDYKRTLLRATVGAELMEYWKASGRLGRFQQEDISWEALGRAMKDSTASKNFLLSRQLWMKSQVERPCYAGSNGRTTGVHVATRRVKTTRMCCYVIIQRWVTFGTKP